MKAAAAQRLAEGQAELDLALDAGPGSGPLEIASSRMGRLWDALCRAYDSLGFSDAAGGDVVFRDLTLAGSSSRRASWTRYGCLLWWGLDPMSYRTLTQRLPSYAEESWRHRLAAACATHAALGPKSLVLYDVSTLYFETDKAKTKPMLPTITSFMTAHQFGDVTVVADAGMVSEANRNAIEDAKLTYIIGERIPDVPYQVKKWRTAHLDEQIPDGHVFTQSWPANNNQRAQGRRDKVVYYQYRADRARSAPAANC